MKLVAISDDTHKQLQLLAKSKQVSMKLLVECALAASYSGSFRQWQVTPFFAGRTVGSPSGDSTEAIGERN